MELTDFQCPNCGAKEMLPGDDRRLLCVYCGTSFGEVERICPKCGHYNDQDVRHCQECGGRLIRDCPACGADNWVLAEHCVECGRNLDLVEQMARRWQRTTQERLYERQAGMTALKEQEERASQQRMAVLLAAERERQGALARARAAQKARDRQLWTILVAAAALLVFVMVLVLVLSAVGGGG